ncbi:MAG: metallophosphoesterase [Armatimonadota bacterium]|nr:metallophosphoesterase [Armatimonadota bacterium]
MPADSRKLPWLIVCLLILMIALQRFEPMIRGALAGPPPIPKIPAEINVNHPLATADSPAAKPGNGAFNFVVFGDNRPLNETGRQPKVLSRIVKEINLLSPRFSVHVGDSIYGSSDPKMVMKQYMEFAKTARLNAPMHLVMGNHEITDSGSDLLFKRMLKRKNLYYSFTYGASYFAVLDSEAPGQTSKIAGEQLEWLKQDLRANRDKAHRFIFVHQPLFPVGSHRGDSLDRYPKDRRKLIEMLKENRVDAVFAGHEHLYNKSVVEGITEYICGGSGAPMGKSVWGTGKFPHYLLVMVNGADVNVAVIKPGGIEDSDFIARQLAEHREMQEAGSD